VTAETVDRVAAYMERLPTDPTPFAFQHRIVRGDGTVRSVLVRGEGVVDQDGRVVRFIGTDQDITDRRRADAERRRLLGRVSEAQEGQDRRLAADLHDGHVQSLAAIDFELEQARLRPLMLVEDGLRVAQQALANVVDHAKATHALVAMRERVEALGGRFRVTTAPGRGTVIEARLPLTDPTERWGA
jgi:signal transduction histidine kinase